MMSTEHTREPRLTERATGSRGDPAPPAPIPPTLGVPPAAGTAAQISSIILNTTYINGTNGFRLDDNTADEQSSFSLASGDFNGTMNGANKAKPPSHVETRRTVPGCDEVR